MTSSRALGISAHARRPISAPPGPEGILHKTVGWEYVHVAIDDATRLAYVEVLTDEKAITAIGFLRRAVQHYQAHGITIERLITDNGSPYRSTIYAIACRALGIRHLRIRAGRTFCFAQATRLEKRTNAGRPSTRPPAMCRSQTRYRSDGALPPR